MRLNRGTLILLVAALAVIVLVIIVGGNPTSSTETPTPGATAATGPLFLDVTSENVIALEARNNETGEYVRLLKNQFDVTGTQAWEIDGTFSRTDVAPAQDTITTQISSLVGLQYTDSFTSDQLADFGLDQPAYTFIVTTRAGARYALHVGGQNPAGNRYYVISQPLEATAPAGEATAEATAEIIIDATAEATADAAAQSIAPDATAEPTAEIIIDAAAEATADAAAQSIAPDVTAEATADVTAEPLPTLDLITEPRPVLSGSQQILLVTLGSLNPLINLIATPPYGPTPTPTPTATNTPNPLSEVEMTATATTLFATQAAQMTAAAATPEVGAFSTAEVSVGEATAEATP